MSGGLAPCRCGHPGLGCTCFEARRAEALATEKDRQPDEAAVEELDGPRWDTETPEAAGEAPGGAEPVDRTPEIIAAITEAFPHQEACRFPDTVCECGAAETRRRTATLIADLRLTRAPEPTICRYGHTTADHEAAGACVRKPRAHWLPEQVWLGIKVGEWPLTAFTTRESAERWAAVAGIGERERRIWAVDIPDGTQTFRVETVPASTRLIEAQW